MSLLHIASSAVVSVHAHQQTRTEVPFIWRAIFLPGGVVLMFVVGMLIMIRWDEQTRYERVDKVAIATALVAIAGFAYICRST